MALATEYRISAVALSLSWLGSDVSRDSEASIALISDVRTGGESTEARREVGNRSRSSLGGMRVDIADSG